MIFDDLVPQEMAVIENAAARRDCPAGQTILREGEPGDVFFFILSGRVEVRKGLKNGRYKSLVELGPCGLFGEVGFLGVPSRTATVVALEPCCLLAFCHATFERLTRDHPVIGLKVYRGLARELARRLARSDEDLKHAIVWALAGNPQAGIATAIRVP